MEAKYELKELARLGPAKSDAKEVKVLNRLVRWTDAGIEYEADPTQIERLVVDLELEGCATVGTAGFKIHKNILANNGPLSPAKNTTYRSIAARGNYVGPDRPNAQASKELCRWIASPSETCLQGLKRLGRYFEGHKRLIFEHPFNELTEWKYTAILIGQGASGRENPPAVDA